MAYEIKQGDISLADDLTSFLLYFPFQVNPGVGIVNPIPVGDGYFCFHTAWSTRLSSRPEPAFAGPGGILQTYTVTDDGGQGSYKVQQASLVRSRKDKRSNETGKLFLFALSSNLAGDQRKWLDLSSWQYDPPPPSTNIDATPFDGETFSFGELSSQFLYKYVEYFDNRWDTQIVIHPFVREAALTQLLTNWSQGRAIPQLTINPGPAGGRAAKSSFSHYNVPGGQGPTGYALVVQGAFKSILTSDLRSWSVGRGRPVPTPDWIFERCETCIDRAAGNERGSTIESVDDSSINSVPPASPDGPIEVLCLRGIPERDQVGYV